MDTEHRHEVSKYLSIEEIDVKSNNGEGKDIDDDGETRYCGGLMKKKTVLLIWGTIIVTLANFGYFTGGYYAFNYFQAQYFGKFHEVILLWNLFVILGYIAIHWMIPYDIQCRLDELVSQCNTLDPLNVVYSLRPIYNYIHSHRLILRKQ